MTAAANIVRERAGTDPVKVAMVLGTGLGPLAEEADEAIAIDYGDLEGFPKAGVTGHAGRLVIGRIAGIRVAIAQGREHYYEHGNPAAMRAPLETFKALGADTLVLTNSAGSLRSDIGPAQPMLITDHINFSGTNPLIGEPGDARFVDLSEVYDRGLRDHLKAAAETAGIALGEGVYMWFSGPTFETPAEIRAAKVIGADAVGMSTVPEAILARFLGLRVAALSMITNLAAGMKEGGLSHTETKEVAAVGAANMRTLITGLMARLAQSPET